MVETTEGWKFYTQVTPSHTILRDYRRIMTQIPREHYKTSIGTLANALWQASRTDPDGIPVLVLQQQDQDTYLETDPDGTPVLVTGS